MKKLIIMASTLSFIATSSALAKTEGNYVGINIIKTDMEAKQITLDNTSYSNVEGFQVQDGDQVSIGINYKYAFNFNNFFIAPGIFFDYTNLSTKGQVNNGASTAWDLEYRLGAKVDLGYDITDKFSAYIHGGIVNNRYSNEWDFAGSYSTTSGPDVSPSYGVGVKYGISSNIDLNLEYEISTFEMEITLPNNGNNSQEFDLSVLRAGIAYKF